MLRGFKRELLEESLRAGLGFDWLYWELNPKCVRLLLKQPKIHAGWWLGCWRAGWQRLMLLLSVHAAQASPITAEPSHRQEFSIMPNFLRGL